MLLEIETLGSHYGRIRALEGITIDIGEGELVALVGANGAGKTTLLRCISGIQPVSAGTIRYDGAEVTRLPTHRRVRLGISEVPERRHVFGPMSVRDNLVLGGYLRSGGEIAEGIERAYTLFPELRVREHQPAGTLSGGQQQMLAICRALMARPRLLLLDEPSLGLAPTLVQEVFETVVRLKALGTTILLVEQNASAALGVADRGYVLETGRIILADRGRALLANEQVKKAYLGT